MASPKKSNNNMMIGGVALAALVGFVVLSKKSSANSASNAAASSQDTEPSSDSMVQNSISEDAAIDAQKDAAYEAEDNSNSGNTNQNSSQDDEVEIDIEERSNQTSNTINKGSIKDYIIPKVTSKIIGNGKPKLGVGLRQNSDQTRIYRERANLLQQAKTAKLQKMRKPSEQVIQAALMQQRLRNNTKAPLPQSVSLKPTNANVVFPMKNGSRGKEVTQLQQKLGIKADGIFGKMTEASLVAQFGIKIIANPELFRQILLSKPKSKQKLTPKIIAKAKAQVKPKPKKAQIPKRKTK